MSWVVRTQYEHGVFCWVDLSSLDLAKAKAFYTDLFGWRAEDQDTQGGPPYTVFYKGEHAVGGPK